MEEKYDDPKHFRCRAVAATVENIWKATQWSYGIEKWKLE